MSQKIAHTFFSYNSILLTYLCSKIAQEGREKFLLFFNNFWKITISEHVGKFDALRQISDIMIFQKLLKKQQKFLATLSSYFWAQMGQKCRVVGKNSMCGHQVQFAKHLNVANFRRFFMIFENFRNISIFQREL